MFEYMAVLKVLSLWCAHDEVIYFFVNAGDMNGADAAAIKKAKEIAKDKARISAQTRSFFLGRPRIYRVKAVFRQIYSD